MPETTEPEAHTLLRSFLREAAVRMGDDSVSQKLCALCENRANAAHERCDCPCHPTRELLSRAEAA